MENSFALCIDKAREQMQGTGSAVLRWFNLQSITEVKSQLETMHLLFKAPRFVCSRDFGDLRLKSEVRMPKTVEQIGNSEGKTDPFSLRSFAEKYWSRHDWKLPERGELAKRMPSSGRPLWQEILRCTGSPVLDSDTLDLKMPLVSQSWPTYLELLSLWQVKRLFNLTQGSVKCRTTARIVKVHPTTHFKTAAQDSQWLEACKWMLLGYCNHGYQCHSTFTTAAQLDAMQEADLRDLADRFVNTPGAERLESRLAACPPHVQKDFLLGQARRERAEQRKISKSAVLSSLGPVKFVFAEEDEESSWTRKQCADMTPEEQVAAKQRWQLADQQEEDQGECSDAAGLATASSSSVAFPTVAIHSRMRRFLLSSAKWTHRELHDAVLAAGFDAPPSPSLLNYFGTLLKQYGDSQSGFLPQNSQSHSKKRVQNVLQILQRTGSMLECGLVASGRFVFCALFTFAVQLQAIWFLTRLVLPASGRLGWFRCQAAASEGTCS